MLGMGSYLLLPHICYLDVYSYILSYIKIGDMILHTEC